MPPPPSIGHSSSDDPSCSDHCWDHTHHEIKVTLVMGLQESKEAEEGEREEKSFVKNGESSLPNATTLAGQLLAWG